MNIFVASILLTGLLVTGFNLKVNKMKTSLSKQIVTMSNKTTKPSLIAKVLIAGLVAFPCTMPMYPTSSLAKTQYLVEPTQEFIEEEKRTAAMRIQQLEIRASWDNLVDEFVKSETPKQTETALINLRNLLQKIDTLPTGVKKLELVKTCRAKKFEGKKIKKSWTKDVEIAYQALIQQYNREANPKSTVSDAQNRLN